MHLLQTVPRMTINFGHQNHTMVIVLCLACWANRTPIKDERHTQIVTMEKTMFVQYGRKFAPAQNGTMNVMLDLVDLLPTLDALDRLVRLFTCKLLLLFFDFFTE